MSCPKCEYSLYQEGKPCNRCGYTPIEDRMNIDADLVRAVHVCVAAARLSAVLNKSARHKLYFTEYEEELAALDAALAAYDPELKL